MPTGGSHDRHPTPRPRARTRELARHGRRAAPEHPLLRPRRRAANRGAWLLRRPQPRPGGGGSRRGSRGVRAASDLLRTAARGRGRRVPARRLPRPAEAGRACRRHGVRGGNAAGPPLPDAGGEAALPLRAGAVAPRRGDRLPGRRRGAAGGGVTRARARLARHAWLARAARRVRARRARFIALTVDSRAVLAGLDRVRYTLRIKGAQVTVSAYEDEPDYGVEVEEAFARFRQGDVESHLVAIPDPGSMDHVEARIALLVARIYPDEFRALDEF